MRATPFHARRGLRGVGCGDGGGVVTEAGNEIEPPAECFDVAGDRVVRC